MLDPLTSPYHLLKSICFHSVQQGAIVSTNTGEHLSTAADEAGASSRLSEILTHVLPTIAICHTPLAPLVIASSWTVCCQRSRAQTASDREIGSVQEQLSTRSIACKLKSDRCAANALAANMATNAVWMLSQ